MNCCNHPEVEAVATCCDCGQGLCEKCSKRYNNIIICDHCNKIRLAKIQGTSLAYIIPSVILFIGGFLLGIFVFKDGFFHKNITGIPHYLICGYILAGFPWGWKFMSKFRHLVSAAPNFFVRLFMNVFVFIPLRLLTMFISGLVAMPIYLIKPITNLIKANKNMKSIEKLEEEENKEKNLNS